MKTKILFLWLFVLLTTAAMSQNLVTNPNTILISSSGYSSRDVTNSSVNVRPGTLVTIVATLPSAATASHWTADQTLTASSPAQTFPVTAPTSNTVTLVMPAVLTGNEVLISVYFNTSPVSYSYVKLVLNNATVPGLLTSQQNIQDCPDLDKSFSATSSLQAGFNYQWTEFNGSAWVNLGVSSYYSALNHVFNLKTNNSIVGKRFKCVITNPNCLGAVDETAEIVMQNVYTPPTATFSPNASVCAGQLTFLVVTPANGLAPYSVTMNNNVADLIAPNSINPVINVITGGSATFSVKPNASITYHFTIMDGNGCIKIY